VSKAQDVTDDARQPDVHELHVRCSPVDAFATYVGRRGSWWPTDKSDDPDAFASLAIGPDLGGPVLATYADGRQEVWGEVTAWQPPHRLRHLTWAPGDRETSGEVEVTFTATDRGTDVRVTSEGPPEGRSRLGDWATILHHYEHRADHQPRG
jgi:hypothetical protein